MKIIAFAGSNSTKSINKQLATYASSLIKDAEVTVLNLNNFELPTYSIDIETEKGIPANAQKFFDTIQNANGIVLSLAEHNGNFSSAFKNLYDWMSRIEQKLWNNTPMLLMATSPGARGGASVLAIAKSGFPYMGGNISVDFSLPNFYDNFKEGNIVNEELRNKLKDAVAIFEKELQV